jgi:uncharacterized protein (DUF1501 family)
MKGLLSVHLVVDASALAREVFPPSAEVAPMGALLSDLLP